MAQARPGASAAHHLPNPLARRARRERLDSVIAAERRAEAPAKVRLLPKVPIHLMMLVSDLAFAAEAKLFVQVRASCKSSIQVVCVMVGLIARSVRGTGAVRRARRWRWRPGWHHLLLAPFGQAEHGAAEAHILASEDVHAVESGLALALVQPSGRESSERLAVKDGLVPCGIVEYGLH